MNNYQNPNGQFGGWGQNNTPYNTAANNYNYAEYYKEQYKKEQDKKNDKKMLRKAGKFFGFAIIAYVVLSFAIAALIGLLSRVLPPLLLLYEDSTANYAYSIVGSIIYIGLPFALVYLGLKSKKIAGVLPFGTTFNRKAAINLTMMLIPVMILSSIAVNVVSLIIQGILGIEFTSGLEDLEVNGVGGFIISTISMAIVPAIIEEFAIRGVVMQPLRRYGDKFAIIGSALIFSIMHGNMAQIPYTVVGGIYLGYLAIATGSIWPSIVLHFVNNMYSVVIMTVSSNFGDSVAGVATACMMLLFVVVGIIGGFSFSKMRYKTSLGKGVNTLNFGEKVTGLFANVPMIIAIIMMIGITITSIES